MTEEIRINLKGMNQEELESFFAGIGENPYRGKQMMKWIYEKAESDFTKMTDFGKPLRALLEKSSVIKSIESVKKVISQEMDTEKYLFRLNDGNLIESVIMSYEDHLGPSRMTACISTQLGCPMGCRFCASTLGGFIRDLTCSEIIDQVLQLQKLIQSREMRIANVVMMGIGEPLLNYDNVIKAARLLNHPDGIAIGMRHIAISTCGIVPKIRDLADEGIQVKLAVSLHSANDEARSYLMPVNKKYPLLELRKSLSYYQEKTGRRITIEYALIDGLNDSAKDAHELIAFLKGFTVLINLIPLNKVSEFSRNRSTDNNILKFKSILDEADIRTTVRKERGVDINAACGQLRRNMAGT